jgi:hypothetical protein
LRGLEFLIKIMPCFMDRKFAAGQNDSGRKLMDEMKIENRFGKLWVTFGVAVLLTVHNGIGQSVAADSVVRVVADAQGLALVPPDQVPPFGTFWVVSPGFSSMPAPLPCAPLEPNQAIYQIADGQFLVDATADAPTSSGRAMNPSRAAAAVLAQADALVALVTDLQTVTASRQLRGMGMNGLIPIGGGSGDYGDGGAPAGKQMPIDTNRLWLEIITVTNQTALLVIHPPAGVTNEVYDLLYATNLLTPPAAWQWVLRSYPDQTNLIVLNAKDAQGFYRLSSPNDSVANSSLGTNFWLAFPSLYNDGSNQLSLIISSPAGATGTVTLPGLWTNGPTVIVSGGGDAAVNGTNVFRKLTAPEQAAWAATGLDPIFTGYIRDTNWVVVYAGYCYIVTYDSRATNCTLLYDKYDINLTGSTNEWQAYDADPSLATPATYCAQVPLVSQFFTVAAGAATNISIPLAAMLEDYDMVEANGIQVTSSAPVSVYGLDYDPTVSAAFTGYPTPLLGTNYCVLSRAGWLGLSELAIVATMSNTTVRITPSATADLPGYATTNFYYVPTMQAGQTYQIASLTPGDDVTGTWIQSDKPIAVFAGTTVADVPDGGTVTANPLMQEQMPVESWGSQVLTLSFAGRGGGDTYRVLSASSNNLVTITTADGTFVANLSAGGFCDTNLDGPVEFLASQPVQIAHFADGATLGGDPGDPCEILLPPISHCLMTNIVVIPGGFDLNYLNLIVPQSAITNTILNGSFVAATNFLAIGTSGFFGAQIPVTNGVWKVTSSQPVDVEVYGFSFRDAYGCFGGIIK